jgi:hypothetical protein
MIVNPIPVGRDGSVFLLIQRADMDAGNHNGPAQCHDVTTGEWSPVKPLQVWLKFNTYVDTTPTEYAAAQEAVKSAKFNPYHDNLGRFASGPGGYASGRQLTLDDLPAVTAYYNNEASTLNPDDPNTGRDPVLGAILGEQGFDGLPEVVDGEQMDALIAQGYTETWRGVSTAEQAEQFRTGELYVGTGCYGNGTNTAANRETARDYSNDEQNGIIRMAIRPEARVIELGDLHEGAVSRNMGTLPERQRLFDRAKEAYDRGDVETAMDFVNQYGALAGKEAHTHRLYSDHGRAAALEGFDAIQVWPWGERTPYYIILNRTAVVVQRGN